MEGAPLTAREESAAAAAEAPEPQSEAEAMDALVLEYLQSARFRTTSECMQVWRMGGAQEVAVRM